MGRKQTLVRRNRVANQLVALTVAGLPRLEAMAEMPAEAPLPRGATSAKQSIEGLELRFEDEVGARLTALAEQHDVPILRVLQAAARLGFEAGN